MASIKFGEGITLGMEMPEVQPAKSMPEKDEAPLRMPQISASEVADEVLARIEIPTPKAVNLAPLQADMSAIKIKLQASSEEIDEIRVNQHRIEALSNKVDKVADKVDKVADKPDFPDHSAKLSSLTDEIIKLKKQNRFLIQEMEYMKYAGIALILGVLGNLLMNLL